MESSNEPFQRVCRWENLLLAYQQASKGKRGHGSAAAFEHQLADRLVELRDDLLSQRYRPGPYRHFQVHDPKTRKISAAPFRDRVVHHALCNVIEPVFERGFIADSYANRVGKGTHKAIDRLQQFSRRYTYVLRLDVVQHFPSIDHEVLLAELFRHVADPGIRWLMEVIVASGVGILDDQYSMVFFPGDDLFAMARPRGLPIGNLTSQFWSNCYLNPLDHFIKRELRCRGYLRYVDDMALFSDDKRELWEWRDAIIERLASLRLTLHSGAQAMPVGHGIPWLGFIVYPTHRRLKGRNVRRFASRFRQRWQDYCEGRINFGEFDASMQGWINHVRYADTWGLRRKLLGQPLRR
jgi:retron-type reverse transcriptase